MDQTPEAIREAIHERFSKLARSPESETGFPIGPQSAKTLGYPADAIDALPASATESFAGVGHPFPLLSLQPGETVLDLGCGAGMDSLLAAQQVGPAGQVIGVDLTAAMIEKARANAEALGATNVEFRQGDLESLPVDAESVEAAFSNGVFNLCLDKPRVLREVFRVVRAGGRLVMADMILEDHVTPEKVQLMGSWSG